MSSLVAPTKTPGSTRTDEEHFELWKAYIVDGLSAAQTAKRINRLFPECAESKNSVVAYATRQGWIKAVEARGGTVAKAPVVIPDRIKPSKRKPGPKSCVLALVDPVVGEQTIAGVVCDLVERSCRWPVGPILAPGHMADQLFCGEAQDPAVAPYCLQCAAVAYPPEALQRKRMAYAAQN